MSRDTQFVRGAQRLSQRIRTIRAKLALPAMVNEIGELLLRRTLDRFDNEVDPDGNAWKPLSNSTLRNRARLGFAPDPILQRTRKLRNSIRLIRGDASGSVYTNTGAGIRIGVDGERALVAAVQNHGSGHVPARRFLGIGALDVKSVDSFLRRQGQKAIAES